jgi:hypothetical protein
VPLAILIVAALLWIRSSSGQSEGLFLRNGPLATDSQDVEGHPTRVAVRLGYAGTTLFNTGTTPIALESAALYPRPRGLEQLAAYVVPPGRALNAVTFIGRWPHSSDPRTLASIRDAEPLRGSVLAPTRLHPLQQGDELVLILRPATAGDHFAAYVYIRYRVGTTEYAERLPRGVVVCARTELDLTLDCDHRFPDQETDPGSVLFG